ncbi:RHS repeat domain-containing protein [Stenotrophomonas sp. AB1(2024)]|uniref:RHS repeat domain-containing protein n=1 Tax=Stenotrophomonas sp. AB1(2024) TaxID=3132215 RepID=UPI0030B03149
MNCKRRQPKLGNMVAQLICLFIVLAAWPAAAQTVTYVHTDALGSVVAKTDENGNVVARYDYEPYGAPVGAQVNDGPGYTGHVSDSATGLSYMQQRYMDPQLGVFLSVDPIGAASDPVVFFNRYKYATNNPYKFTDPDGRCAKVTGSNICGGGGVASAMLATSVRSPLDIGARAESGSPNRSTLSVQAGRSSKAQAGANLGGYRNLLKPNFETEAVAAYGAGMRYTRDWKTKKDALGIVMIGVGAHGGPGSGITGLPSLDVVKAGYNWGGKDSPVDIVANFKVAAMGVSVTYDPGTGLDATATASPSIGAYTGISFMFDDTLVPDK